MKISQLLQIQSIIDKRAIPSDMYDEHLVYYSKSKDRWIAVADMDICHLIRVFRNIYDPNEYIEKNEVDDIQNLENYINDKKELLAIKRQEFNEAMAEITTDLTKKLEELKGEKNERH